MTSQRVDQDDKPHFLSEADCHDLLQRLSRVTRGGGLTSVIIKSSWTGNVRWARNQISTSGDVRNNYIQIHRNLFGADGAAAINDTSDEALVAAARRAERLAEMWREISYWDIGTHRTFEPFKSNPHLFSESTYQLDAEHRAAAAVRLAKSAVDAGMLSAGYIEVSAKSIAQLDTLGRALYLQYTGAQYSVTVRDPQGTGSGWAGLDWNDWSRIDADKLSKIALDKCLKARNPVAVEPGRYTTILEPQATCDLVGAIVMGGLDREFAEAPDAPSVFFKAPGPPPISMLGDKVVDERITISSDPMDPDAGFPPFNGMASDFGFEPVYHASTWIKNGVLTELSYSRKYAIEQLGLSVGKPNPWAYRMSGGDTSIAEMISTTKRGLLVTRFSNLRLMESRSLLLRGYTRDGLWLIQDGQVSKPVKNMVFTESVMFALNNVLQLGVPERVYHPGWGYWPQPVVVPPLKVADFSFTALADAI
jgi:predicted Zn-dependent protease